MSVLKRIVSVWFSIPLVWRVIPAFLLGVVAGLWIAEWGGDMASPLVDFVEPFGTVLISMLKMVVIPIIFFSLILGTAALPLKKSGRLGLSVIVWYLMTSIFATVFGVVMAFFLNPEMEGSVTSNATSVESFSSPPAGSFGDFLTGIFLNPFEALSDGRFLSIVIFSILTGLAARVLLDASSTKKEIVRNLEVFLHFCDAAREISFTIIGWVMEYFPFGVAALTFVNFSRNGLLLFGPYLRIIVCVIICVTGMIFLIYPLAIFLCCRENPYRVLLRLREPIITAFVTRSSAATLPISLHTADKIGIAPSLSSFSLPLGCTINMDGVCVHLPVFVILAGNIYHIPFTSTSLLILLASVVFASIGAGGIPGGSVFLLFMILENAGFTPDQVAGIVALALGINPILDMFETACNVTGDNVCTYVVAKRNGMISPPESGQITPPSSSLSTITPTEDSLPEE